MTTRPTISWALSEIREFHEDPHTCLKTFEDGGDGSSPVSTVSTVCATGRHTTKSLASDWGFVEDAFLECYDDDDDASTDCCEDDASTEGSSAYSSLAADCSEPGSCEQSDEDGLESDLDAREQELTLAVPSILEAMNAASDKVNTLERLKTEAMARHRRRLSRIETLRRQGADAMKLERHQASLDSEHQLLIALMARTSRAKDTYSKCLRDLEAISSSVHALRQGSRSKAGIVGCPERS